MFKGLDVHDGVGVDVGGFTGGWNGKADGAFVFVKGGTDDVEEGFVVYGLRVVEGEVVGGAGGEVGVFDFDFKVGYVINKRKHGFGVDGKFGGSSFKYTDDGDGLFGKLFGVVGLFEDFHIGWYVGVGLDGFKGIVFAVDAGDVGGDE